MYEPNPRQFPGLFTDAVDPRGQLYPICVRAIAIDDFHVCAERYLITENGQHGATFDYATTKSMLRLKAHDQYGVPRVGSPLC